MLSILPLAIPAMALLASVCIAAPQQSAQVVGYSAKKYTGDATMRVIMPGECIDQF
ncbi:hypothetical protein FQN51_002235, partial [Onygenales sp. PD_10]